MAHLNDVQALRELTAPARNNYFYGKMLNVLHFEMEQAYFNRKRWLLNRVGLGAGVLCGLDVEVPESGQQLWLRPGVAVDPLGREVIVPRSVCIDDPRQPTDDCGRPDGDRIEGAGAVTLMLCYHECEADAVPVLVGDCDAGTACAPNVIRERFRVQLVAGAADAPAGLSEEQCAAIFPETVPDAFDRRMAACTTLDHDCSAPTDECIPIAIVRFSEDAAEAVTVEPCAPRTTLYSNSRLFDLILCLADRVDACCGAATLQLQYVSGDAQSAAPGTPAADPLVVSVVDAAGNAVADAAVSFTVRGGGGTADPVQVQTDADGRARTTWTLGAAVGLNTLAASIQGAPEVPFFALGVAPPAGVPPVIMFISPDPAIQLSPGGNQELFGRWMESPFVAITFDRKVDEGLLRDPAAVSRWLRMHQLIDRRRQIDVRLLELKLQDIVDDFQGRRGSTAIWALGIDDPRVAARYLVQAHADLGTVTDTSSPPLTLDADFAGTTLPSALRDALFNAQGTQAFDRAAWDGLTNTGSPLPRSGDGNEGGQFDAWFEVQLG